MIMHYEDRARPGKTACGETWGVLTMSGVHTRLHAVDAQRPVTCRRCRRVLQTRQRRFRSGWYRARSPGKDGSEP